MAEIVLRGRHQASAIARRSLAHDTRRVGDEIGRREDPAGPGDRVCDRRGGRTLVEGCATPARDSSQRLGERRQLESLADGGRVACAQQVRRSGRLRADRGEALEDHERELPIDHEPGLGTLDRGLEHLCKRQPPGPLVGRAEPGHGTGDAARAGAMIALVIRHRRPLQRPQRLVRLEPEEIRRGSAGRARSMIDGQETLLRGQPGREMAVAAEPGVVRLDHEGAEGSRHGGIDGVAALGEDPQRRAHLVRMPRGDGAARALTHRRRPPPYAE